MNKKTILILILSTLLIAACGEQATDGTAVDEPVATAIVEAEEVIAPAEEAAINEDGTFTNENTPCKPFNYISTKLASPFGGLPEINEADWVLGPNDAVVTFMEYSEPQCPYCAQLEPILTEIQARYPDDVRVVYRHRPFPETFHDKSIIASQALEAAGKQGKFQELKNYLFETQSEWAPIAKNDFDGWLESRISQFGLDADQFFIDMYSDEIEQKIADAQNSANSLGINGTPTLFINGYKWAENERGLNIFSYYIELIKNSEIEYNSCPPLVIQQGKEYSATISTNLGEIEVDLFADIAPYAVNSFVFLANEGWYDGLPFIAAAEFVLSGDPSDTGYGGPGYAYLDELDDSLTFDQPGKLATFSIGPGINGSSFFINKTALEGLQARTIFGEVTSGMNVVNALELRDNIFDPAVDTIISVTITER
jgi:cyclophilin family peptidyl-prolyl cis-trans isomerase/protein-disulfide isomerase